MPFFLPLKIFSFSKFIRLRLISVLKISKFMVSQPGKQTIAMQIFLNVSRRKRQSDNKIWSVNII